MEAYFELKLFRWAVNKLRTATLEYSNHCAENELNSIGRIAIFLLSVLSVVTTSCDDLSSHLTLGVPAVVIALRKWLSYPSKTSKFSPAQVIFDGGHERFKGTSVVGNFVSASLSGSQAAALMKLGVRVVRGPDWKWGDQVKTYLNLLQFHLYLSEISVLGWNSSWRRPGNRRYG